MDTHSKLRHLAQLHGLQLGYTDIHGTHQAAGHEPLQKALAALGVDVETESAIDRALDETHRHRHLRRLPPVVVAWDGQGSIAVRLPESVSGAYRLHARSDDHEASAEGSLADAHIDDAADVDGQRYVTRTLALPTPLPPDYYQLRLETGDGATEPSLLVSAPRRVYTTDGRRGWGLFIPLYALRSKRDHGVGDFTDLGNLIDWVGDAGGNLVGTLPLLATFLDESFEPSPYAPVSRLAWNEMYLDVESLPEYSGAAKKAFTDAEATKVRAALREARFADHAGAMALKRRALEPMAEACWKTPARRKALDAFLSGRPELDAYARFRATASTQGKSWHDWPQALRDGNLPEGSYDPTHYRYHAYVQWAAHTQLTALSGRARERGSGLYLDLPVGVHGDGFDTWAHRGAFVPGLSTGAPPDALFAGGQNWAFPPPHPERQRESHYRYLIAVLQNHLRYAGVLRIDHVMGLHRLFVIPSHAPASDGMYLRYPADELYALLSLESHRSGTVLIGENLGTVPDEVQNGMQAHGISGMHVVQYQARPDRATALPPARGGDMASLNTHDMPPFAAYWTGADLHTQQDLGFIDEGQREHMAGQRDWQCRCLSSYLGVRTGLPRNSGPGPAMEALLQHLGRSDAHDVLVNLEDLWGETHAQNVPGTWREHANWQNRARFEFETWTEDAEITGPLRALERSRNEAAHRGEVRHDVTRLTEDDLYLWNEGTHAHVDQKLGAHPMEHEGMRGTYFAVWAPSATYVSVIGDFNVWDRQQAPLAARGSSGIWEGFIVGVGPGDLYKLHIASPDGNSDRADPFAFAAEEPPRTASVITHRRYDWRDADWMETREARTGLDRPMSIYEVHLGSWRRVPEDGDRWLNYRELGEQLAEYAGYMGFTHVQLLPVMEHPFYGSWGYQTTGYFAPSARYGTPRDFKAMVDTLHQAGIGVLLDWVPSHFPTDAHALAHFDGTHLFEHADPKQGFHPDWKSAIFNYDRHEVRSFLQSSARYWCDTFHADGLRVDAVASMLYLDYSRNEGEWVPNRFGGRENLGAIDALRSINEAVYRECPGVQTIAEESTSWPMVSRPTHVGGLGFGFKWDMGWMHDTLTYFGRDPIYRRHHQHELTFRMLYAFGENFVLPLSHDEVVHGKGSILGRMPGDHWQRFANLRSLYGYMYGQPGKKLLFMGCEFGQEREWNHDQSLDWHLTHQPMHAGVQRWVADLNALHRDVPALHEQDCVPEGFAWVDFADAAASVYSFLRFAKDGTPVLVVCNFTPVPRYGYGVGVPRGGWWKELANSDAAEYGGSGEGNGGRAYARDEGAHGHPFRLDLTLPPLSVLFLTPEGTA